ncbi:MAG: ferritin-like domain-containing protein, partial [Kocuria sp.]|nr:ferritin-like domain-containing protein [Kocuria sp.]
MAFNIDKFAETSQRVKWADLDMGEFVTRPLPEDTLRCLRYMCDVEYHTVCYMRDMLVTPSHQDKDVSTFMTMWNR